MSFKQFLTAAAAVAAIGFGASSGQAASLVINGDFSAGNTGFSSDYTYFTGPLAGNGTYSVVPSNGISGYADWTANAGKDPSGAVSNLLVADGDSTSVAASASPKRVWYQSIALTANTQYTFSFSGIDVNATPVSNAKLALLIDGLQVGELLANQAWQSLSYTFNSGLSTSLLFALADNNRDSAWNDFAIDDIALVATTPVPPALLLFLTAIGGIGFLGWHRRRAGQNAA